MFIRNATLIDGTTSSVAIAAEHIADVGSGLSADGHDEIIDGTGWLLVPAFVEPHAHLDKALTADLIPNPAGDLMGAIHGWVEHAATLTHTDIVRRASLAVRRLVANGTTVIRTHVDVHGSIGTLAVEALAEVREAWAPHVTIQIVGLCGSVTSSTETQAAMRRAVEVGLDVVGGCPHIEDDPVAATQWSLDLAAEAGLPVDLHTDENLRPDSLDLLTLADRVIATGFPHRVAASHCVSLGIVDRATQERVAARVAEAGIDVITLPQTNLFLQSRDIDVAPPRGLTALRALSAAGVNVAAGADNLEDPFNLVGRADPLETAALMVMAGHLSPAAALAAVSSSARHAVGLPAVGLMPGSQADLVLTRADTLRSMVASAPGDRVVISRGRAIARSTAAIDVIDLPL
jgi:cytosine/creatinine deaminase